MTKNPETRNTPVWVLPNIWRLEWVRTTKFRTNVSDKMLLNTEKCQDYSFYCFWVIEGKPTGGKITPVHTQIRVNKVTVLNSDPGTDVFLRIFGIFKDVFYRTPLVDCFWTYKSCWFMLQNYLYIRCQDFYLELQQRSTSLTRVYTKHL